MFGTHNVAPGRRAAGRAARTAGRSLVEILEATVADDHEAFPSRAAGPPRGRLRRLGHHPDRLRQLVRLLHRPRRAGPGDQPAVRRHRRRGRGAGRRRRHRGDPARPEREHLRPRPHPGPPPGGRERPGPPAVRRPAAGGRRGRGHPPGALHEPPPQGPPARDHRGHGRGPRRCASTSTCPLQAGSDRVLAAMHRGYTAERYLGRLAAARAAMPDLAVTTDIIVGFPGETDDDFERTLEVVAEAGYDSAYTFIYCPRPGTEAAGTRRRVRRPPRSCAERFERLRVVVERSALARHRGPGRPGRGGAGRGPVAQGPGRHHRPHPAEQAGPLRRRRPAPPRHLRPGPGHRRRAAPPEGRPGRGHRAGPPPDPHPRRRGGDPSSRVEPLRPRRSSQALVRRASEADDRRALRRRRRCRRRRRRRGRRVGRPARAGVPAGRRVRRGPARRASRWAAAPSAAMLGGPATTPR